MTDVPVVVCSSCDGMTFTLASCRCTDAGDRLLIIDEEPGRQPYRDCRVCQGVGTVAHACHGCGQTGRRRAQLVLTVANLDTGGVASANVVPGVLEPRPWPGGGGWHLPVAPLVRQLAATVGAGSWTDVQNPHRSADGPVIFLPRQWTPELPTPARQALEAEAIANQCHHPWHVFLGRTAPEPPRNPDRELGRLCLLADLLCLDLVVEARRRGQGAADDLSWDIRYELPGAPVPAETHGWSDDLPAAVATTTVTDAMYGLAERGRTAPAHYLRAARPQPPDPPTVEVDQLERRIVADCTDLHTGAEAAGAQAIWRDGRWWHTTLRIAGTSETLTERTTGQIASRQRSVLRRGWQPPAPSRQGAPIPYTVCPDCQPGSRLRACLCTLGRGRPDGDCPGCAGAGRSPSALPCDTCQDSQRVYHGLSVTITDLHSRPVHLSWLAGDLAAPAPPVATQPGGKPVHQLPERYRLARWAGVFGVRPEDLTHLDGGSLLDQDLRDGVVTVDHPGQDPLTRHLALAGKGQPGGRLLVLAAPPEVPPLADLIRLVLGLHLAVTITMQDHSPNHGDPRLVHGESWDVTVRTSGGPVDPADPPTHRTPEAAIRFCLDYLELTTAGAVPTDPGEPIPIPQTPRPVAVDDPVPLIRQLGRHHSGHSVTVHFDRTGCRLHLRERGATRHLATAPTLPSALTALGLGRNGRPGHPG